MICLEKKLALQRCPHCSVDRPNLELRDRFETTAHDNSNSRYWGIYVCTSCGGVVTAMAREVRGEVEDVYPRTREVARCIPSKAKSYLEQALGSLSAPSGATMLAASAVDAMLKSKDYKEGSLYKRIDKAAKDHLITEGMAQWAHQIRLDANDERHADDAAELPKSDDAKRSVEFALALAEFLFVLPERVTSGLVASNPKQAPPTPPQ